MESMFFFKEKIEDLPMPNVVHQESLFRQIFSNPGLEGHLCIEENFVGREIPFLL